MQRIWIYLCLGLWLQACAGSKAARQRLVGNWRETWAVGQKTDVDYHDVYHLRLNRRQQIELSCPARSHYAYESVTASGERLRFTLVVQDLKYGQAPARIRYALRLDANGQRLTGTATDADGKKFKIEWDKLNTP
ncbi:MAG: hypothetical protein MUC97_14710 [Bernardetiaceae bacterium]|nr:hypothetical protein [Bernardetiaceae bacterium]